MEDTSDGSDDEENNILLRWMMEKTITGFGFK